MTTVEAIKLTDANARCDRCNAKAVVIAVLPSGGMLLFCQHHTNEHEAALRDQGAAFADRTN